MTQSIFNIRLDARELVDHVVVRTYFGHARLTDFVNACIETAKTAGKPVMFRDQYGDETWFHGSSSADERIQYMRKHFDAQMRALPIREKITRAFRRALGR